MGGPALARRARGPRGLECRFVFAAFYPGFAVPFSVVLITRNAAAQLPECLASVAFADEVIVVDSGSTDGTGELAARMGARVVAKEWLGFGRQKQFAVEQAAHDWVLCLDA